MRVCTSLLSLALALTGCVKPSGDFGFSIEAIDLEIGYQRVEARLLQQLSLSAEATQALEHGVPLTVAIDLELRDAATLTLLNERQFLFEIRYLPLSRHYQLTTIAAGDIQTFPRLRHALAALASLELEFPTGALAPGSYEIRARTRLDKDRMPAPMRLPTLLSGQWQHHSEWSTWPFDISA